MDIGRLSVVIAAMAAVDGDPPVTGRVCGAAVSLLAATGAGLSLMVDGELHGVAGVTGPGIASIQELQLTFGQGPCVDAVQSGEPVIEADLNAPSQMRWPAFAPVAADAGVRGVFAFPLRVGAIKLGVLAVYRDRPGGLDAEQFAVGVVLADLAVQLILGLQAGAPADRLHRDLDHRPGHWAQVHQATGVLSVQLDVSLDDAMVRLRAHAFAENRPLRDVAIDIIEHRLRLER